MHFLSRLVVCLGICAIACTVARHAAGADRAPRKVDARSYTAARDFLAKHTTILELTDRQTGKAKVLVCPEYQGRVMTSAASPDGRSHGWINVAFIASVKQDKHFHNYGGEDRLWLAPEGGPYSLWFAPGAEQTFDNWITPPALNQGAFEVARRTREGCTLRRKMDLLNALGTKFSLDVERSVRLVGEAELGQLFGDAAAAAMRQSPHEIVAFQTINAITNRGAPMQRSKGLLAIWILGMFQPTERMTVIVPYRGGDGVKQHAKQHGAVVKSDYFGEIPRDRLRVTPEAIFFKADGQFRSKIGTSPQRTRPVAAAYDPASGWLTLVHFSMPQQPQQNLYVNNTWGPQKNPYEGDAFNSYNDGPLEPGKPSLGGFFELESLSPAVELKNGQSIHHVHTTVHFKGAQARAVMERALGLPHRPPAPAAPQPFSPLDELFSNK